MTTFIELFDSSAAHNSVRLAEISEMAEPNQRYIIAMTPRSGSSYLCDVLTRMGCLGNPGEFLNHEFLPDILQRIPGRTPGEYFCNVERVKKTANGIFGLKASWFQFSNFVEALGDEQCLSGYKYIYLTRRNLAAQAVSLYKATSSSVFHTNIAHASDAVKRLETLDYDFLGIDRWHEHIVKQENGWREYFRNNGISPCCVCYEDIDGDIRAVVSKIAAYLGLDSGQVALPPEPSVFAKVSDRRNTDWADRYLMERVDRGVEIVGW